MAMHVAARAGVRALARPTAAVLRCAGARAGAAALMPRRWCSSSENTNTNKSSTDEKVVWYALWRSKRGRLYLKVGLAVYCVVLGALWWLSEKVETTAALMSKKPVGRELPRLGGPLKNLTDHHGRPFDTTKDLDGKWWLVYFGFASCPTVCPAELTKITGCLHDLAKDPSLPEVTPLFVTLDPDRDTPEKLKEFLVPFHKKFIGLTGTEDVIKAAAKQFRVYYSVIDTEDQDLKPGELPEDYQLDHSCIIYLMSPKGLFCEFFSKETDSKVAAEKVRRHLDGTMSHIHDPDE